ncbi:MAG: YkgJ family cysteine cluster protein [Polyangiales bacterium]
MEAIPARPRLADHALARLQRDGAREHAVLIDQVTGEVWQLGLREWVILSMADGTRDLDGLLLAAAREGALASRAAVGEFLMRLAGAGLLEDGPAETDDAPPVAPVDRPLDPLPGYRFACDGRGVCCSQYATVVFSRLEADRARVLLPLVERGGERLERVFTPRCGSTPGAAWAVKHVDGACAYLAGDGRCAVHAAGGADAKPFGCSLFPARFVDDGEAVRVTALVECSCVVRSATGELTGGDPIVPGGAQTRSQLPPAVHVAVLPEDVALTARSTCPRDRYVAWSRAARDVAPADVAAWLWWVADRLEADGELPAPDGEVELDPASLGPWARSFAALLDDAAARARGWRAEGDVVRDGISLLAEVAGLLAGDASLLEATLEAGAARPEAEQFYLRAAAHGHTWMAEAPLDEHLRTLALRVLAARAIARFLDAGALANAAFAEPLATVEALSRGYGLHAPRPV